jgi:DNA-binding NarL/FixJ family response regulator
MSLVLCDDHRMFVDALALALRARDHDVAATCSDLQALPGVLRQARPDLCVLGVQYGGRARPEVAEMVRASVPGISVLVLTGWPTENLWRLYDSRTIDGLVSKSVDIRTVDLAVRRVLAGEHLVEGLTRPVPAASRGPDTEPLTAREREVITLLVDGVSTALMAESLGVSTNTVRSHVQNVLRKLGVHHRSKAAHRALELGLVRVAGSLG